MVETMIRLCQLSRRAGVLELSEIKTESRFLKKACDLIADGSEENVIRSITVKLKFDGCQIVEIAYIVIMTFRYLCNVLIHRIHHNKSIIESQTLL